MSVLYKESMTLLKKVNVKHLHRTFVLATLHSSAEVNDTAQNHCTKTHNLIAEPIKTLCRLNLIMPQSIISGVKDISCFYYIILIY